MNEYEDIFKRKLKDLAHIDLSMHKGRIKWRRTKQPHFSMLCYFARG